jgi:hypothetical protein
MIFFMVRLRNETLNELPNLVTSPTTALKKESHQEFAALMTINFY